MKFRPRRVFGGGGLVVSFFVVVVYFSRFYCNSELKNGKKYGRQKTDLFSKGIRAEGIFFPLRVVDVGMLNF